MNLKTIGVIAPASATETEEQEQVNFGLDYLKSLGLELIVAKNIFNQTDHGDGMVQAGSTQERLDGFHEIWGNPKVDAVISVRGGYGSIQLLDKIDFDLVRKYPKPLLGYSDLTALQLALNKEAGIQSVHSPMLSRMQTWHPESKASFEEMLTKLPARLSLSDLSSLNFLLKDLNAAQDKLSLSSAAKGNNKDFSHTKVMGGNMTILSGLIGTAFLPNFSGSILFIEEFAEPKYKNDRTIQHMKLAGIFDELAAIIVGIPTQTDFSYEPIEQIAKEKNIALVKNVPVGHCDINLSIPIG